MECESLTLSRVLSACGGRTKKCILAFVATILFANAACSQEAAWELWASGLPRGSAPRLSVAPDHSIFFGLQAISNGHPLGVLYRASTKTAAGSFTAMPPIPYVSLQNDIQAVIANAESEPVAGIFHGSAQSNLTDPVVFRFDTVSQGWMPSALDAAPGLGVFSMARAPDGTLWLGAKWSTVYKSTDGGRTFKAIDESAKLKSAYPCYYPSIEGNNPTDGAIYSINVDGRGRVYAGTEGAGVVYSDDQGTTWNPADAFACGSADPAAHNTASPMEALSYTGNVGAIGFTADNNLVWNGSDLFAFSGWMSSIGYADMTQKVIIPTTGFVKDFIYVGLQVTKIVTTSNGVIFLHSGTDASFDPDPPPPPGRSSYSMGIYSSTDGINWTLFNAGITSKIDGLAEGSLATDGNLVFMATSDGNIWRLDASQLTNEIFGCSFE